MMDQITTFNPQALIWTIVGAAGLLALAISAGLIFYLLVYVRPLEETPEEKPTLGRLF
ncbi:hypothetical protein TRICHSKD4_4929 [Roseibium sp. TrichSKD4]|uniref:hypothetical protein n=1 Tax=Roseibium sp. TrichSKD4 TaxID=744980 RepID=UPI0001E572CA|nr:hypothetical protein [Roseibium sp. TrichSKD4]EFO29114.1 hypothetical protein TRICHSKD4_4929 [Roseibium sp. TrichSKD4]